MTARPEWVPIEDETADLLTLVADTNTPSPEFEWTAWLAAVRTPRRRGATTPRAPRGEGRSGRHGRRRWRRAFTNRALAAGLLVWRGDWVVSDDHEGRNGGKPCRQYVLGDPSP